MQKSAIENSPLVALVGLGQMGAGIARNLDRAGLLFAAYDLDKSKFDAAGLSRELSNAPLETIIGRSEIVLFAVPTTQDVKSLVDAGAAPDGQIIIDLTTSAPAESEALARMLSGQGRHYLDAAMTGGAAGADQGALALMVGGDAETLLRCQPVLDVFTKEIFHLGPAGSGHAMKLVHNMILHSSFLATCEGLGIAVQAGLDPDQAVAVLNAGNARSFVTETRFPRDILSGTMDARSQISNLQKDLGLAVQFSKDAQMQSLYGELSTQILTEALDQGHGNADFSNLYPLYENLAKAVAANQ